MACLRTILLLPPAYHMNTGFITDYMTIVQNSTHAKYTEILRHLTTDQSVKQNSSVL